MRLTRTDWQLPPSRIDIFRPKQNDFSICVFVINEGQRIRKQLIEMKPFTRNVDIIIADGGSTDNSLPKYFLKKMGVRALLTKMGDGHLGAQMRMAFAFALREGYEGVITIDGNHKDGVRAIPKFITALKNGFDHIQGSRFIKGGQEKNTPLLRLFGIRLVHAPLVSMASHQWQTDTTNGFRAYSAKLLANKRLSVFRNIFTGYELHYYLSIQSAKNGFKMTEIPVTRSYPRSHVPTKITSLKANLLILKALLEVIFGKYNA